jgi:hypothetical protein
MGIELQNAGCQGRTQSIGTRRRGGGRKRRREEMYQARKKAPRQILERGRERISSGSSLKRKMKMRRRSIRKHGRPESD